MDLDELPATFDLDIPGIEAGWPTLLTLAAAAIAVALALHWLVFRLLDRIARRTQSDADEIVVRCLHRPTQVSLVAFVLVLVAREVPALEGWWERFAGLVMPALVGWIVFAVFHAFIGALTVQADISVADNRNARRRRTRLAIFSRIGTFLIVFLTVAMMLLSIPGVRDVGVTLMASAGLAGLAVGAAAQPALKSLIAGFQMAATEPISIDDVVVIDGEWGRIEDIRTTYVVVKVWDERRLIVPTTRFLEHTFQNWTRDEAQILAPVSLHLDPLTKIPPLREEFERQLADHPLWDGRVGTLQVTEAAWHSIEVRMLASAGSSGDAWDLRCDLREGMLAWIAEAMPEAVVRHRATEDLVKALES